MNQGRGDGVMPTVYVSLLEIEERMRCCRPGSVAGLAHPARGLVYVHFMAGPSGIRPTQPSVTSYRNPVLGVQISSTPHTILAPVNNFNTNPTQSRTSKVYFRPCNRFGLPPPIPDATSLAALHFACRVPAGQTGMSTFPAPLWRSPVQAL